MKRKDCKHLHARLRHHTVEDVARYYYECPQCALHSDYEPGPIKAIITWRKMIAGIEENARLQKCRRSV